MKGENESKGALEVAAKTIGRTPWLLGLFLGVPLVAICAEAIILTVQGQITGVDLANFAGMLVTLVLAPLTRGYLARRKKKEIE